MEPVEQVSPVVQVGVDIGQRMDPTALVVMELQRRGCTWEPGPHGQVRRGGETHFVARMVQRLALGTSYLAVAARLGEVDRKLRDLGRWPYFWVDATGVGQPVVDLLTAAGIPLTPVYLTGSDQATRGERGELRLGKALLVSRLQVLLQGERVHLPATAEAGSLAQELLNYEIRVNENAAAQFGAFRVGRHDDLATALGLACWEEQGWGESAVIPAVDVIEEADRGW
jgi:hypothetical protein